MLGRQIAGLPPPPATTRTPRSGSSSPIKLPPPPPPPSSPPPPPLPSSPLSYPLSLSPLLSPSSPPPPSLFLTPLPPPFLHYGSPPPSRASPLAHPLSTPPPSSSVRPVPMIARTNLGNPPHCHRSCSAPCRPPDPPPPVHSRGRSVRFAAPKIRIPQVLILTNSVFDPGRHGPRSFTLALPPNRRDGWRPAARRRVRQVSATGGSRVGHGQRAASAGESRAQTESALTKNPFTGQDSARILRLKQVAAIVGLGKSSIYRKVQRGPFRRRSNWGPLGRRGGFRLRFSSGSTTRSDVLGKPRPVLHVEARVRSVMQRSLSIVHRLLYNLHHPWLP